MKQLGVINISFIRQSYLFLYRRDGACLPQLLVRRHYFSAWMLPLDRLKLASHLTLLASSYQRSPEGTQLTTSIRPDSIQNTHIWHYVLKGLLVCWRPLKLSSKEPLANGFWNAQASSGISGQVGHKSACLCFCHGEVQHLKVQICKKLCLIVRISFEIITIISKDMTVLQTGCRRLKWSSSKTNTEVCISNSTHKANTHHNVNAARARGTLAS